MIACHEHIYAALKLSPDTCISVVDGGLFNDVHRVIKADEHFYIKTFKDEAKNPEFPPLPTTAFQRYSVAVQLHEHAQKVVTAKVYVPRLLAVDPESKVIAMEGALGKNLYDYMLDRCTFRYAIEHVSTVLTWLKSLHTRESVHTPSICKNSAPFKHYKASLQYRNMLEHLPLETSEAACAFLDEHLCLQQELLHGDLNSRNIIICGDGQVAVIDFEQGQVGCGSHDAAYLISEMVIAGFAAAAEIEALIDLLWRQYEPGEINTQKYIRFRRHLCFQVLYRLKGPSREVWTGHLDDALKAGLETWCIHEAARHLRV